MKAVYKFYQDFRRQGDMQSIFLATPDEVEKAMGKRAYFGEALGKHSEVWCDLHEGNITLVSDSPDVVKVITDHQLTSGRNPLYYLQEEDEDEDDYPGQGIDEGDEEPGE